MISTIIAAKMNRSLQLLALIVFLGLLSLFISCLLLNQLVLNQLEGLSSNELTLRKSQNTIYVPSVLEDFVMNRLDALGFSNTPTSICKMWLNDPAYSDIDTELKLFEQQLEEYATASRDFQRTSSNMSIVKEITRTFQNGKGSLSWDDASKQVCETLRIRSPFTNASSLLSHSSRVGFLEPLLPTMRHPGWCKGRGIMDLGYLVHDFYTMCRNIKPASRIILVDVGASLIFHGNDDTTAPSIYLISKFRQFGFYFDHIYAFEATPQDHNEVYQRVLNDLVPAYHWMNIPVQSNKSSYLNPLRMILHEFEEDDLVLVKVDIDTPDLELNLVNQLFSQENDEGQRLSRLIDHFYFEHHVAAEEMWMWDSANGTVKESLILFQSLRKNGISSHYWV